MKLCCSVLKPTYSYKFSKLILVDILLFVFTFYVKYDFVDFTKAFLIPVVYATSCLYHFTPKHFCFIMFTYLHRITERICFISIMLLNLIICIAWDIQRTSFGFLQLFCFIASVN